MDTLIGSLARWVSEKGYDEYAILMIGNSGSGKSTVAAMLSARLGIRIVSSDAIRKELSPTSDELDQSVNHLVWPMLRERVSLTLRRVGRVIVDATNAKSPDRIAMIDHVKAHTPNVFGIWMDIPLEECLKRNLTRTVPRPEHAIKSMNAHLNEGKAIWVDGVRISSTRPSLSDGFSHLWRVDISELV